MRPIVLRVTVVLVVLTFIVRAPVALIDAWQGTPFSLSQAVYFVGLAGLCTAIVAMYLWPCKGGR